MFKNITTVSLIILSYVLIFGRFSFSNSEVFQKSKNRGGLRHQREIQMEYYVSRLTGKSNVNTYLTKSLGLH
jgi:hypothetical protein